MFASDVVNTTTECRASHPRIGSPTGGRGQPELLRLVEQFTHGCSGFGVRYLFVGVDTNTSHR